MAVYCFDCSKRKDWPRSPIRTAQGPCNFCGAKGPNYSYPDNLLEGTPSDINQSAEREYEGKN